MFCGALGASALFLSLLPTRHRERLKPTAAQVPVFVGFVEGTVILYTPVSDHVYP